MSRKSLMLLPMLFVAWISLPSVALESVNMDDVQSATLQRVSVAEGLSQGSVSSIYQDNSGYIWLGTESGLNFYNGYEVRHFYGDNEDIFSSPINFVFQQEDGLFWISFFDLGLYTFDPKTERLTQRYAIADDIYNDVVDFWRDESNQQIWFVTSSGVIVYDTHSQVFSPVLDMSEQFGEEQFFTSVAKADNGFILGSNKGFFWLDDDSFIATKVLLQEANDDKPDAFKQRIRRLLVDAANQVWLGTARGVYRTSVANVKSAVDNNESVLEPETVIPALEIEDLVFVEGTLFAATQKGMFAINPQDNTASLKLQFSNSNFEVYNNRIRRIFHDRSGNFWLASVSRGIYVWNPRTAVFQNRFNSGNKNNELSDNVIWDIHEQEDKTLWIATTNGLSRIDPDNGELTSYFQSDGGLNHASNIIEVKGGEGSILWLSTWDGMKQFDTATEQLIPIEISDPEYASAFNDDQSFFELDSEGRLWIVTLESYYVYDPDTGSVRELDKLRADANPYFSFGFRGELDNTNLMLLTGSGQLWGVDKTTFEPTLLYELPNNSQQAFIYIDNFWVDEEKNWLWLSFTKRGVIALSLEDFRLVFELNETLESPVSNVYGLMPDEQNRLWFSSHDGIYALNLSSNHLSRFDTQYGLSVMEFNSGAHTKLSSGELVYGSVKGITRFNPANIGREHDLHRQVYFDRVSMSGTDLQGAFRDLSGERFVLPYDHFGLDIYFSSLGFEQQPEVRYHYQLISDDMISYPITKSNHVSYTRLMPGDYEFEVTAISPKTGFRTRPSRIYFTVEYMPWASPMAKGIYLSLFILLAILMLYRRKQKQMALLEINRDLQQSKEKLHIALRSSNSYAWQWRDNDEIELSDNSYEDNKVTPETFKDHYADIHPDDRREFLKEWQLLFDNEDNDAFNFNYRMRNNDGQFCWYRNVGRILERNEAGKPTRISGLFTDISEIKSVEESASIFGEAFRNTKDWVVIIDADFNGVMANHSFYSAFNITPNSSFSLRDEMFSGLSSKMLFYKKIMESMFVGEHWHGEDAVTVPDGTEFYVLINISLIKVENREEHNYVVIFTDITKQKKAEEELRHLANYDALTSLPNRTLLIDRIEHAIQVADRHNNTLALLFLDLDRFKPVNDSLGHEYGDMLLKKIAQRLKSRVRKQDTVARLGGDEFVVLLESFKDVTHVGEVAQEIADHIGRPIQLGRHKVSVAPSIGIALYPSDAKSPGELLRDADIAMYHAKKDPSHCFHFYTDSMDLEVRETLQKEYNLKQAQVNQEFINYYQPIVDCKTREVTGAELLLRWRTMDGIIAPKEFIPLSEQIGLIIPMTNDALSRGLGEVKKWREQIPDFFLSLNLSVIHFEQENIVENMATLLAEHGLPPSALRVEVTESSLMSHPDKAITTMRLFMEKGIMLSLDDFGTGYSSFAYLKRLPLNTVKLDRSFIWGIGNDEKDEIIVDAILAVAESMDLFCVAEGVESEEHVQYLANRGCHFLQGYLFSKPLPSDQFSEYLAGLKNNGET